MKFCVFGAGAVGAIVIMFGASSAWRLEHTGQIVSLGLLAVTLYLTQRVLVRRGIGASVLAGLAAAYEVNRRN